MCLRKQPPAPSTLTLSILEQVPLLQTQVISWFCRLFRQNTSCHGGAKKIAIYFLSAAPREGDATAAPMWDVTPNPDIMVTSTGLDLLLAAGMS